MPCYWFGGICGPFDVHTSLYIREKSPSGPWRYRRVKEGRGLKTGDLICPFFARPFRNGKQFWKQLRRRRKKSANWAQDLLLRRRASPRGYKSQSEADWAYAKRALSRGDPPEEVVRRIADYRAHDKHDPEYYARRTVLKAQAELQMTDADREVIRGVHERTEGKGL